MKTIYCDMDGVLSNFTQRYIDLFNETPTETLREKKMFSPNWHSFIDNNNFATLDEWPGSKKLIHYLTNLHLSKTCEVKILTSTGGKDRHEDVERQKIKWLNDKEIIFHPICVAGRRFKKDYANSNSIIIDDTWDVIESFTKAGGFAIHHIDVNDTISILENQIFNAYATHP